MNPRTRRLAVLFTLGAILVAAVVIAVATSGGDDSAATKPAKVATPAPGKPNPVETLFAGIPQKGFELGASPVVLEEFVDPQCPFCAELSRNAISTLVNDYVKPGKLKVVLRPLAFLGNDSVKAAKMFAAAALQNRAWQYADAFYANQGEENSGYVTPAFMRQIGTVAGLDVTQAMAARNGPRARKLLATVEKRATAVFGDDLSTPSLVLTKPGGKPKTLELEDLHAASLTKALDAAL